MKHFTQIICKRNFRMCRMVSRWQLLLFLLFPFIQRASEINFRAGTWEQVQQEAISEMKPVFVDAYTPWCGVCRLMDKNIFSDDSVADFYNKNFICWKADMSDTANMQFGNENSITSYPTLLYFSAQGELIFQYTGYKDKKNLIETGNDALRNSDFIKNTSVLRTAYNNCTGDKHILYRYYTILKDSGRAADSVGIAALQLMTPQDLENDSAFRIWFELDQRERSPFVDYFLENRTWFENNFGRLADQKPRYIIAYNLDEARKKNDTAELEDVENFIRKTYCGDEQLKMLNAVKEKFCRC